MIYVTGHEKLESSLRDGNIFDKISLCKFIMKFIYKESMGINQPLKLVNVNLTAFTGKFNPTKLFCFFYSKIQYRSFKANRMQKVHTFQKLQL